MLLTYQSLAIVIQRKFREDMGVGGQEAVERAIIAGKLKAGV